MILTLFFILLFLILLFLILPGFFYKKINDDIKLNCNINNNNNIFRGDGFVIVNNILNDKCRETLVNKFLHEARNNKKLNEYKNLQFLFFFKNIF